MVSHSTTHLLHFLRQALTSLRPDLAVVTQDSSLEACLVAEMPARPIKTLRLMLQKTFFFLVVFARSLVQLVAGMSLGRA